MRLSNVFFFTFALFALGLPAAAQFTCPVTQRPETSMERPDGLAIRPNRADEFDVGSPELWIVHRDQPWRAYQTKQGFRWKLPWFSSTYIRGAGNWAEAPIPNLIITARHLDTDETSIFVGDGVGSYASNSSVSFIPSTVDLPSTGCWEITGHLGDVTTTFVVEVVEGKR